ncbi:MAG: PIN domain-containing protein [Candidatus Brocadiaceae bacterium]|nr:PIN domain-containing protein [Candidatus Brocadiaceae bacterium]
MQPVVFYHLNPLFQRNSFWNGKVSSNNLIFHAAEYKAQYSISYADCFILASAIAYKAVIVTGDPEFKKVEHLVNITWI